jgi:serine/threonine protein kinase
VNPPELSLSRRVKMARHATQAIAYLHSRHIAHRDIKSSNFLVRAHSLPRLLVCSPAVPLVQVSSDWLVKCSDFGTAKLLPKGAAELKRASSTVQGTPLWMAPEVRDKFTFKFAGDIYSLGIVIYEILERDQPLFDETVAPALPSCPFSTSLTASLRRSKSPCGRRRTIRYAASLAPGQGYRRRVHSAPSQFLAVFAPREEDDRARPHAAPHCRSRLRMGEQSRLVCLDWRRRVQCRCLRFASLRCVQSLRAPM